MRQIFFGSALRGIWAVPALAAALAGCSADPDTASEAVTEYAPVVRIVEVLATPSKSQPAFVELRNDAETAADVSSWAITAGGAPASLKWLSLPGTTSGEKPASIAAHGLALVVDESTPVDAVIAMACEAPVATTRAGLGEDHLEADDVLASTLELQKLRRCVPVFTAASLGDDLGRATSIVLRDASGAIDSAEGNFGGGAVGFAFERRGKEARHFDLSPLGSTPGQRNFYRGDQAFLEGGAAAPLPIRAMSSSPWRVGDSILALERDARAKERNGDAAGAEVLRQEAQALREGKLPHNPLVQRFDESMAAGNSRLTGSFYQINDPLVIDTLVAAKERGADVRLTTDASFFEDEHYVEGFKRMTEAGIEIAFDFNASKADRPPLSHNKFITIDERWLWTGSFNPIEDEPSRIHADNALLIDSPALASLHDAEFETLFGGQFGADKREVGVGGGRFSVDGAEISVRFSPGLTGSPLKRRAKELVATGDAAKACDARLGNGKNAIPERYRQLDPCGGPYDLIMGEVARATSNVYFVSFSLALDDLGTVVMERMGAGVEIKGVVDPTVASRGIIEEMIEGGADVRYTPNSDPTCPAYVTPRYACPRNPNKVWLHHKFVLVDYGTDHPVVLTGSHNMSQSAEEKNDEALVVIRDRAVAESYYRIFREAYDHPQTMGVNRDTAGLPALAITEVLPSADGAHPQFVEIANVGTEPVALAGVELWNRVDAPLAIESGEILAPGEHAVVAFGDVRDLGIPEGTVVVENVALDRPFVRPVTSLVLRSASDKRWIATFDPYTAEQNLPAGVTATLGASYQWPISSVALDALSLELLGKNVTPEAEVPTWEEKGFFSDWADEHDVNATSLLLMLAPRDPWMVAAPSPGR
jgi:phosphatidylserine/phosphatidylglycerophosphate/cardiolipin synthase-like enzyme